jgi:hypothetical protein
LEPVSGEGLAENGLSHNTLDRQGDLTESQVENQTHCSTRQQEGQGNQGPRQTPGETEGATQVVAKRR